MSPTGGGISRRQALAVLVTMSGATLAAACSVAAPVAPTQVAPGSAGGAASGAAAAAQPTAAAAQPTAGAAQPTTAAAQPTAGAARPTAGAASAAAQPKLGGALRVGAVGDVANVDPQSWGPRNGFSIFMAYDTLTTYDLELKPQPQLAESWDQTKDGKQLTVKVRKGVQFHTGRELTSDDVAYSLGRPLDSKLQASIASFTILPGFVPTGTTFEAPDKYTVVITSPVAWPSIFDYFQVVHIVDKDTAQGPITNPVGTGPFKFVEWVQGQYLRFEKNPNYWLSGRPYLDAVQVNVRSDIQTMTSELEAGASDLIVLPSWIDFVRLKADPSFQAVVTPMPGYFYMFQPNVTFKPLDDKRVRQALNYAIDRKRIVESVILGQGIPMATPWRPNSPAFDPTKQDAYAFDLDKARSLLAEAGASNLTLDMVVAAGVTEYATMTQIYQNDLQKIGITLNIKPLATAQRLDLMQHQTYDGMYAANDTWAAMEPVSFFTSSSIAGVKRNNAGYYNDRYTQLVNTIATEPDVARRKALYGPLNDFLLDESFYMPITGNPGKILATSRLQGLSYRPNDLFMLTEAWLA
jgi:peptide/nickel transport system substrate-binding protein